MMVEVFFLQFRIQKGILNSANKNMALLNISFVHRIETLVAVFQIGKMEGIQRQNFRVNLGENWDDGIFNGESHRDSILEG